jgi:hypothetical protein
VVRVGHPELRGAPEPGSAGARGELEKWRRPSGSLRRERRVGARKQRGAEDGAKEEPSHDLMIREG